MDRAISIVVRGISASPFKMPAEIQKRDPSHFGDHQVNVLKAYVNGMHAPKFTTYVGRGVENFNSRREALDSGKQLTSGQIRCITKTMIDAIRYLEHYRSEDYIEPEYDPDDTTNEEVKEFVAAVMEEVAADIKRLEAIKKRSV
ncbi:hypothetical protein J7438_09260 [Thalassotalea sp. G20_0]|uniref:hypothetical protein n=1 Tax=Thalassotalea sp. G20_0 TaxID=2821093 RepID=UPI001AD96461|nr:hypothetical protein [Thalassotalea sp. G20_0]MBO9494271.1 hypothetical protein [Thalassotalea sp. G20_0]